MTILTGDNIKKILKNIIHEPSQKGTYSFDLTLKDIYAITEGGQLDFGGSEFEKAKTNLIPPVKKHEEDKYGWYSLNRGEYLIEFNESFQIKENQKKLSLILPLDRLHKAGVRLEPKLITEKEPSALLSIQTDGVEIKENARVATVISFQIE